jgi:hypothetical protein
MLLIAGVTAQRKRSSWRSLVGATLTWLRQNLTYTMISKPYKTRWDFSKPYFIKEFRGVSPTFLKGIFSAIRRRGQLPPMRADGRTLRISLKIS